MPVRAALTGGIASGKSYCLKRFAELGVPVIDADLVAREVVAAGTDGLAAIARRFGPGVLDADGSLNRSALASIVFADEYARQALEDIIHPQVYQRIADWFQAKEALAIADIPLLYETGRHADFDAVIVAACPRELQMERLLARGMTADEAELRLAAQLPIAEKAARADYVIDTSSATADTDRRVIDVWERLRKWGNGLIL